MEDDSVGHTLVTCVVHGNMSCKTVRARCGGTNCGTTILARNDEVLSRET